MTNGFVPLSIAEFSWLDTNIIGYYGSPSHAVKHDEVKGVDSGRGRVEAHKRNLVLREPEMSLATALEDEV